jgi:hypothetical protein
MKILITKSKGKWAKQMAQVIPKEVTEIYTKMLVEALTNQKVTEMKWER